ncbi:MAG TPA: phosphoadenylyl-sulfate reductase [Candidatus Baltobacteraceae bacterium]|nr:phosphoadenylyl-sulfate reductase [Candidatus Baltobacteraceae bacterium]
MVEFPAPERLAQLADKFEGKPPEQLLTWAIETYHPKLVLFLSLGGAGGMVIADILLGLNSEVPVAYIDTGLLFAETYDFIKTFTEKYGVAPVPVRTELSLEQQAQRFGEKLWEREPDRCCALRKVAPQREFLKDYGAWITGIRRDQASTRSQTSLIEWDAAGGLAKINPLAGWTERDVWRYVADHGVPTNPLLSQGYASIGCTPCTRPVASGEDSRAGRWSGFGKTECGLHINPTNANANSNRK